MMDSSEHAKALSALGAKKGGVARAKALSAEERSAIARAAVSARWEKAGKPSVKVRRATHHGELATGGIECAVLEDGTRVLSRTGFLKAIGRQGKAKGGRRFDDESKTPVFLTANNLKPFITNELLSNSAPIPFVAKNGLPAMGYRAELLPQVCRVFLDARRASALQSNQEHIAAQCEILVQGLAQVGIIALVDEATGFQYDRPRKDLEELLKRYLSDSLRRWVRTFPSDYFKHLCRLRNVEVRPDMRLPRYFGKLTNNIIYKRLAPGLLRRLKEHRQAKGKASDKLHSWLSEDRGFPEVLVHLGTVVGLMKIHTDYEAFEKQLDQVAPMYPDEPGLFDDPRDWDSKDAGE